MGHRDRHRLGVQGGAIHDGTSRRSVAERHAIEFQSYHGAGNAGTWDAKLFELVGNALVSEKVFLFSLFVARKQVENHTSCL